MKRIVLFVIGCLFVVISVAQVREPAKSTLSLKESFSNEMKSASVAKAADETILFWEDFEGETVQVEYINSNGDDAHWDVYSESGSGRDCAYEGNYGAGVYTAYVESDDWLTTKEGIILPADGQITFSFYARSYDASYLEDFDVKLSTSGKEVADFSVTLAEIRSKSTDWELLQYDLTAYAGQTIYLAFHSISNDKWELYIDNVKVEVTDSNLEAVTSTFDADIDTWTTYGDGQGLAHYPTGGNPGGYIGAYDAGNGSTWYFMAPQKYLGNKSGLYGNTITFDLFQDSGMNDQYDDADVVLIGGGTTIVYNTANNPGETWTHYSVTVSEGAGWKIGSLSGADATEAEIKTVLASLTSFRIRGEYQSGSDQGFMDNVVMNLTAGSSVGTAALSGIIKDAVTGNPISGAVVSIGGLTVTTGADGSYAINNLPAGSVQADFIADNTEGEAPLTVQFTDQSSMAAHVLQVTADDYIDFSNEVFELADGETRVFDISLSPTLTDEEFRIVLNWGENPRDMDAHLRTPDINGSPYHVYYSSKGSSTSAPYATLDQDERYSYGPETMTINQLFSGNYQYYVKHYTGTGSVTTSQSVVKIYSKSGSQTVQVPTSGTGDYWYVCDINGATGAVTLINTIQETEPGVTAGEKSAEMKEATAEINTWSWDFGDGTTSTEQNPSHQYTQAGTYTVSLEVSDGTTSDTQTKESYITVTAPPHTGVLSGKVTNAVDGEPIAGATVSIGGLTATTDAEGNYTINNIPAGTLRADFVADNTNFEVPFDVQFTDQSSMAAHVLQVTATDYIDFANEVFNFTDGETRTFDISLSPTLTDEEVRIVLNWGENPRDMDAHLRTPEIDGQKYHIYYSSKGTSDAAPYATLDHDERYSYGPETVTIYQLVNGKYQYYVKHYEGTGSVASSQSVVKIYTQTTSQTIPVPTSGTGDYWHVCEIDGLTGAVKMINQIVEDEPGATTGEKSAEMKAAAAINTWSWDFGDGTSSTEQNPLHSYTQAGTYTVSLTVSDGTNSDTMSKENYIFATSAGENPSDTWDDQTSTIYGNSEAEIIARTGDIDNLGFGWPDGFNPFSGNNTPVHAFPFTPETEDAAGTDRIMIGSGYNGNPPSGSDGYTSSAGEPEKITLTYDLRGTTVATALLQMFVDDFQASSWSASYQVTLDGTRAPFLEEIINSLSQTGPIGKLISVYLPEDFISSLNDGTLEIFIDDPTTGAGDGFAIDFARLLINPNVYSQTATVEGYVYDESSQPLAGATVWAANIAEATTDATGYYKIENIPAGLTYMKADADYYAEKTLSVDLISGQVATQNFNLDIASSSILLEEEGFKIYPNPVSGKLNVSLERTMDNALLQLVNSNGQILYQVKMNQKDAQIDVDKYVPGMYFIKCISDDNTEIRKILIK